ncbi:MAG: sensor histidine kinase, partial [Candidatus Binatia bacterium]
AQDLEQQLIASGRLVSLGVVTASMAHEVINPLGIVMGFTQELLNEASPDSRDYQALQIIDEETRRCQKIIQELLQFARPRSADLCPTDIKQAIDKTSKMVTTRLYKQKIEMNVLIDKDLPLISADPQQLEQVLVNLFLNAIDAMPNGGNLTVEAMLTAVDGNAPLVAIAVTDNGNGIDEADLSKIFQPFFSAKKGKGIGLGLSICDRIIQNHGGTISVESKPGKGTSFKIHLPLEYNHAEETTADSTPETHSRTETH